MSFFCDTGSNGVRIFLGGRMKQLLLISILALLVCFGKESAWAGNNSAVNNSYNYAVMNINNWEYWQRSDGLSARTPGDEDGGIFPFHTAPVLYWDGIVWGGKVLDPDPQKPQIRAGGQYFRIGTQPGWIEKSGSAQSAPQAVDPQNKRIRIYRFRRDFASATDAQLLRDAADYFRIEENDVTATQIDSLRNRYWQDARDWPADLGAPYYDRNRNGRWDADYDEPGIAGADQLIWYVVNDLDGNKTERLLGSPPIGLEIQVTLWAYKEEGGALANTIFKRYRIINKSGFAIDSMFIGQWAETDLGDYSDDFVGCDSALNIGFTYNGKEHDNAFDVFSMSPPAVAYQLLQGPETGDGQSLPMTSFWFHASGGAIPDPELGVYEGTVSMYGRLNGYAYVYGPDYASAQKYMFFHGAGTEKGQPTFFPLNGDPISGKGDIDGADQNLSAGNRYFFVNSGPFTMQPGETQDIIVALTGGWTDTYGSNLGGVVDLQKKAPVLQQTCQSLLDTPVPQGPAPYFQKKDRLPDANQFVLGQNFPNPFNNSTQIRFQVFQTMPLTLTIYNALGQNVRVLYNGMISKGDHTLVWNGKNGEGEILPSGLYFVRLLNGARIQWRKMIYLK